MALGQGRDTSSSLSHGTVPPGLSEMLRHLTPEPATVCWTCLEFASQQDSGPALPWVETPADCGPQNQVTQRRTGSSSLNDCPKKLWVEFLAVTMIPVSFAVPQVSWPPDPR